MEQAQDYSFNKAHAACYALIAYRTAWLKANHPCEYMAALISSVMNTKDRVPFYVNACDEIGIEVLPPDVNSSQIDFAVVEGKIRFGLNAVKGVGDSAARAIIRPATRAGRSSRSGTSPSASTRRLVNKRVLEALVKCGALDSTGGSRQGMLAVLEQALAFGQQAAGRPARRPGLDLRPRRPPSRRQSAPRHHPPVPAGEFEKHELLRLEKETLGLYVSEHPLDAVRDQLRRKTDCVDRRARAAARRRVGDRRRDRLGREAADDEEGRADGLRAARRRHRRRRGGRLQLRLRRRRGEPVLDRPDPRRQGPRRPQAGGRDEAARHGGDAVRRRRRRGARCGCGSTRGKAPAGIVRELAALVRDFPGEAPVFVGHGDARRGGRRLELGPEYRVAPNSDFFAEVKRLLGEAAVLQ